MAEDKMIFIEKLQFLMDKYKKTRNDIVAETGIPRATIDTWFNRNEDSPKTDKLYLIAKYFNVSMAYLCDNSCTDPDIKEDDTTIYLGKGESLSFHLANGKSAKDLSEHSVKQIYDFISYIIAKEEADKKEETEE